MPFMPRRRFAVFVYGNIFLILNRETRGQIANTSAERRILAHLDKLHLFFWLISWNFFIGI